MDDKTLFLVIVSSVVFLGVIFWKALWFIKFINSESAESKSIKQKKKKY